MEIQKYLDSTYLKLPSQSGLTEEQTFEKVKELTQEAIENHFCLVMIRPEYIARVKEILTKNNSEVKIGTVIGFHEGTYSTVYKLDEAKQAIKDGVDELDYVINYESYKRGEINHVKAEFITCTKLALEAGKTAKWIIEIAALTDEQIADICKKIATWAVENFKEDEYEKIFVKSSTGFYKTADGKPNGATFEGIEIMLKNAKPLPVKAAGGVKTYEEAVKMIEMGVKRIGTSSAKQLINKESASANY